MKKVNIFSFFLFIIIVTLVYGFSFTKVSAETHISNNEIIENTTWTKANSPYIIDTSIYIYKEATLTIEPGVIVKFNENPDYNSHGYSLYIAGKLIADGTKDPIYFTSNYDDTVGGSTDDDWYSCDYEDYVKDENGDYVLDENGNLIGIGEEICEYYDWYDPSAGDWDGVYFSSSNDSELKNVFFRYADEALSFESSNLNLENLNISDGVSGMTGYDNSSIKIVNGNINNLEGDAFTFFNNSSLDLKDFKIENVWNGFSIFNSSSYIEENGGESFINKTILNISNLDLSCENDGITLFNKTEINLTNGDINCGGVGITLFDNSKIDFLGGSITGGDDGLMLYNGITANINEVKIAGAGDAGIVVFQASDSLNNNITVSKSEITGNANGFIVWDSPISAHQNSIHDNTVSGVTTYDTDPLSLNKYDFTSNYWGDSSGPTNLSNSSGIGDIVSDNILFTPFLKTDPLIKTGFSNVLFIPGLEASRLYKQKSILGIPVEDQLWEPNNNPDVKDLFLNPDGTSIDSNIYTRDIIRETNTPIPTGAFGLNIYKTFADRMTDMADKFDIADWRAYAYDWRQGVEDIINNGTQYQDKKVYIEDMLKELIDSSKSGKVTIIAHSNGGLIAKALLEKLKEDKIAGMNNLIDSVDVLILVAVPEIGTAVAVPAVMHGYDQRILGGFLMRDMNARELGRNMPSSYGLLPSREYINRVSASPVTFKDNVVISNITTKLVQTFGSALDSYSEYKNFLFGGEGRVDPLPIETSLPIKLSENLFTKAEVLHDKIDNFVPPESLRVVEVAGWGLDTVASFEYYPKYFCYGQSGVPSCGNILDERPRFTSDGDKTVVVPSAHYMGFLGKAEKYWVDLNRYNRFRPGPLGSDHKDILEVSSLNNFILSIIKKEDFNFDTVLKNAEPIDDSNRLRLSIQSPVTLDAYDIDGNHTGKICPTDSDFCYIEEDIINSLYMEFGEGKYLNIPEDQVSKVKLQGTEIGSFTYESEKVLPSGVSVISSFVDIPVTTQTEVEITLNQTTQEPELKLDVTGDGVIDFTISPKKEFDPILFLQVMKKNVESFGISKQQKSMLLKKIDDTIKSIQKGKISKAKLKIEQFKKSLIIHPKENEKDRRDREERNRREHERERKEHKKPKALASTDIQTLITMLNQLLDNLN